MVVLFWPSMHRVYAHSPAAQRRKALPKSVSRCTSTWLCTQPPINLSLFPIEGVNGEFYICIIIWNGIQDFEIRSKMSDFYFLIKRTTTTWLCVCYAFLLNHSSVKWSFFFHFLFCFVFLHADRFTHLNFLWATEYTWMFTIYFKSLGWMAI